MINLYNVDCMEFMKDKPDNYYDLAIVDPPYGIDITNQSQGKGGGVAKKINYKNNNFDKSIPKKDYFIELERVSKNRIIWGGNYMIEFLHNTSCFLVWDKDNGGSDFADSEIAWTSFNSAIRNFRYKWAGMLQENMKEKEKRIHPTQKPKALYKWILSNYAKENDKILDTHGGSMSIALACHDHKYDLDLCELDKDYFEAGKKRLEIHQSQLSLFDDQ
jgi:site-specific DNA-methyltransferase (adenine-specific)